jgi:hypothetical protein
VIWSRVGTPGGPGLGARAGRAPCGSIRVLVLLLVRKIPAGGIAECTASCWYSG